ncbi:MAG: hypothetical protein V4580_09900 [Bacteroidota bacterium]
MNKLLLIALLVVCCNLSAQDSVVYKRISFVGKIVDYSAVGALIRESSGNIRYCIGFYKRLVFSDSLIVFTRYSSPYKKRVVVDSIFFKNGTLAFFTKSHKNGAHGINLASDELLFSYPARGSDYFIVKEQDVLRITNYNERISPSGNSKVLISKNDSSRKEIVFLKNGIVFKTDFAYFKGRKLFLEDNDLASSLSISKRQLEKIIYPDSLISYFDTSRSRQPKIHPPLNQIKHSKYYPYWASKNFVGINLTNFLMCDLNISYYRSIFKNRIDLGVGANFPIYSTSMEISNLSAFNNQYYKFTKNYEFVVSAEYYLFHSPFFRNLSVGLVYRHTNYNYTYVDNSDGYYKNDHYDFIENRVDKRINAGFATVGYFIPVRKRFFFKANIGLGWEQYNDPYQMKKGQELNGSFVAAYTNFMAGFKF